MDAKRSERRLESLIDEVQKIPDWSENLSGGDTLRKEVSKLLPFKRWIVQYSDEAQKFGTTQQPGSTELHENERGVAVVVVLSLRYFTFEKFRSTARVDQSSIGRWSLSLGAVSLNNTDLTCVLELPARLSSCRQTYWIQGVC